MQLLDQPLSLLCFYWFQPDTETDRKKGPFQEEVKWSSSGWRVAFTTLLTRWKNVTIMEALAADSELIGWVPPGHGGARSPCSQTRAHKKGRGIRLNRRWDFSLAGLSLGNNSKDVQDKVLGMWTEGWSPEDFSFWTPFSKHSGLATSISSRGLHVFYVMQGCDVQRTLTSAAASWIDSMQGDERWRNQWQARCSKTEAAFCNANLSSLASFLLLWPGSCSSFDVLECFPISQMYIKEDREKRLQEKPGMRKNRCMSFVELFCQLLWCISLAPSRAAPLLMSL